jgi:hypothetical protein
MQLIAILFAVLLALLHPYLAVLGALLLVVVTLANGYSAPQPKRSAMPVIALCIAAALFLLFGLLPLARSPIGGPVQYLVVTPTP